MKIVILAAALLCATGCATIQSAVNGVVPPAPKTAQQTVAETKAGLGVAEDAALAFAAQVCPNAGACRDARVTDIVKGMVTADAAIQLAENHVRATADGTPSALQAVSDAAGALGLFKTILVQYGVKLTPAAS